ncbi:MAG: hypothetical protein ABIU05_16575, partial [Nitrospirales bacterium]
MALVMVRLIEYFDCGTRGKHANQSFARSQENPLMVSDLESEVPTDHPPAETAEEAAGDLRAITQALTAWRPATRRKVHLDTLALLTWPPGVAVESPAFEHFLASVVAPFCA